jgi:hypothetical protein
MSGQTRRRPARWLRIGLVAAALIVAHALDGSSAQASPMDPSSSTVLGGFTSQHLPSFFKVTGDGRRLTVGSMALRLNCTSGAQIILADAFGQVPISASGRLHASFSGPTIVSNGGTFSEQDSLRGRLNGKHSELTGMWMLAVNYGFSDGTSDACNSGPVRFTATSH